MASPNKILFTQIKCDLLGSGQFGCRYSSRVNLRTLVKPPRDGTSFIILSAILVTINFNFTKFHERMTKLSSELTPVGGRTTMPPAMPGTSARRFFLPALL